MRSFFIVVLSVISTLIAGAVRAGDDRLVVHGYLNQAYGRTGEFLLAGLPSDGTTDLRRAALLLHYAPTDDDRIVFQISHHRLGASPLQALEPAVDFEWVFYERRFASASFLRVGKAPLPIGLLNEVRFVGTVLPFYRAPAAIYPDGTFSSETINGAVISHTFAPQASFPIEVTVFGGEFGFSEGATELFPDRPPAYAVKAAHASEAFGGQLWLRTPYPGVRLGGGFHRYEVEGGVTPRAGQTNEEWTASLEAVRERFDLRYEFKYLSLPSLEYKAMYGQIGFRLGDHVEINLQAERADVDLQASPQLPATDLRFVRDYALGVNYRFRPSLVLKAEGHLYEGFAVEQVANILGVPPEDEYFIISLAASF